MGAAAEAAEADGLPLTYLQVRATAVGLLKALLLRGDHREAHLLLEDHQAGEAAADGRLGDRQAEVEDSLLRLQAVEETGLLKDHREAALPALQGVEAEDTGLLKVQGGPVQMVTSPVGEDLTSKRR